ncbi:hypothetical protein DCAR_0105066 [Daucus carota subsp. sativus]|uniref:Uncharacterized protein n=1 Tax=Daucus carota subsp. sativus TaxID=79200 RepID=A0A166JBV4_DAUCS|nr:hypothetical protein DCAR_0105066 [Daucus carota subsp. sativus]
MCLGEFANDTGGLASLSNHFNVQEENNIAQTTFQHYPDVEPDWDAILQQEPVAVGVDGNEVVKELPVQDAGYAMNAEYQSSNFQTEKSPPLQEIVEIEKDLVTLDHVHQPPVVEDSIHEKGLVEGVEKYGTYNYVSSQTCIEETSKERKSPEKGYTYDILSTQFGKLQDDAAK